MTILQQLDIAYSTATIKDVISRPYNTNCKIEVNLRWLPKLGKWKKRP